VVSSPPSYITHPYANRSPASSSLRCLFDQLAKPSGIGQDEGTPAALDQARSLERLQLTCNRFAADADACRDLRVYRWRRHQGASTAQGVADTEIRLGISAPFTGSAKELGNQMKLGIETAFNLVNDSGGIHGRQLKLVAADDGYEPLRAAESMKELYDKQQVFGFIGNVGTPTAVVALPYALERKALFFGVSWRRRTRRRRLQSG
jgi:ABC-type branched-subunit amino acid transport system substrate-binding protein